VSDRLVVRPAVPGDADALVSLGRAVASEQQLWLTYDRSRSDERRNLRGVRRDPNVAIFVAESPEGITGRLSISRSRHPYSPHVAEVGLMVAAGQRRRGIGSALMAEALRWAREAGVTKVELEVFPHNEAAIALYRKLGFEEEGRRRKQYRIGGHHVDVIEMSIQLD
jgi:RimJ/RimL family protein N-acetyltransferase